MLESILLGIVVSLIVSCAVLTIEWLVNKLKGFIKTHGTGVVITQSVLASLLEKAKQNGEIKVTSLDDMLTNGNKEDNVDYLCTEDEYNDIMSSLEGVEAIICDENGANIERIKAKKVDEKFNSYMDRNNGIIKVTA